MESLQRKIGRRVYARRRDLGLTQAALAEKADLAEATVRAIEAGRRGASVESLVALARFLNIDVGTLIEGDPKAVPIAEEAARLVGDLDIRWQGVVIRFVREVHGALVVPAKKRGRIRTTKAKDRA